MNSSELKYYWDTPPDIVWLESLLIFITGIVFVIAMAIILYLLRKHGYWKDER